MMKLRLAVAALVTAILAPASYALAAVDTLPRVALERDDSQSVMRSAFDVAAQRNAKALVIIQQADMWDPAAVPPGGDGLSAYTPYVQLIAQLTLAFARPVLLLNGDSHLYESDSPLAVPSSATGVIHGTAAVPNLTRITVQGSTNAPAEWLRLTIDMASRTSPFSRTNVPYCRDPNTSCQ